MISPGPRTPNMIDAYKIIETFQNKCLYIYIYILHTNVRNNRQFDQKNTTRFRSEKCFSYNLQNHS